MEKRAKMTRADLVQLIDEIVTKRFNKKLNALIEEKLEEFSDDIASTINEVVEIKMTKVLKEFASKKSLREKILEQAGSSQQVSQQGDQGSNLLEPANQSSEGYSALSNMQGSTGILGDYIREQQTAGMPVTQPIVAEQSQKVIQTPIKRKHVAEVDPFDLNAMAHAEFPDELLEGDK